MTQRIRVGQIFRVPYRGGPSSRDSIPSYLTLTKGCHAKPADFQKGMFWYKQFPEPGHALTRVPAFIFHSNSFKHGTEVTPWLDVVESDEGYCLFHGDNRRPNVEPNSSRGNSEFTKAVQFYASPDLRIFAPPVLVFEQVEFKGSRRGYRRFAGFGVPVRYSIASQKELRGAYFTNLVVELVLFRLDQENEWFSWDWIDKRRDPAVTAEQALTFAPASWQAWVKHGELAIDNCRRNVARQAIVKPSEQQSLGTQERRILDAVVSYYAGQKHAFEGLASFVAHRVLGQQCRRGWITKRSGDGGIDFVCRLDLGDPTERLSRASAVVLGQAKCVAPGTEIGGHALARVVARLQRGWIGVFVTTGVFSRAAQTELQVDRYPILLINGRRVAKVLLEVLTKEGIEIEELLNRETQWFEANTTNLIPSRILEDAYSFLRPDAISVRRLAE